MHPTHYPVSTATRAPSTADTLRHAALYLFRHGWVQDEFFARHPEPANPFPASDVVGAVVMAVAGRRLPPGQIAGVCGETADRLVRDILAYLAWWLGLRTNLDADRLLALQDWNDQPGREPGDVVDELMSAAAHMCGDIYRPGDYLTMLSPTTPPTGPCASGFCIASFCDGFAHVDATGHMWTETVRDGGDVICHSWTETALDGVDAR